MTVEQLYKDLHSLVLSGKISPEMPIYFRHSVHESNSIYSSVDYILTEQKPGALVLCYDDGDF